MEGFLLLVVIMWVVCALLAAKCVPENQVGLAVLLGFFLGPFGVIAAILVSIRKAIEGERPKQPDPLAPAPQSTQEKRTPYRLS